MSRALHGCGSVAREVTGGTVRAGRHAREVEFRQTGAAAGSVGVPIGGGCWRGGSKAIGAGQGHLACEQCFHLCQTRLDRLDFGGRRAACSLGGIDLILGGRDGGAELAVRYRSGGERVDGVGRSLC